MGYAAYLGLRSSQKLGVRLIPPDEREAIDAVIHEERHAIDMLREMGRRPKPKSELYP